MPRNKCPLCDGLMKEKKVPYSFAGVDLGRFPADVCHKCGEAFFTEDSWKKIECRAKEKQLWGMGRRVTVGQSGHSLIVRIPAKLARAAHLSKGSTVYLQPAGEGKLLMEREGDG